MHPRWRSTSYGNAELEGRLARIVKNTNIRYHLGTCQDDGLFNGIYTCSPSSYPIIYKDTIISRTISTLVRAMTIVRKGRHQRGGWWRPSLEGCSRVKSPLQSAPGCWPHWYSAIGRSIVQGWNHTIILILEMSLTWTLNLRRVLCEDNERKLLCKL